MTAYSSALARGRSASIANRWWLVLPHSHSPTGHLPRCFKRNFLNRKRTKRRKRFPQLPDYNAMKTASYTTLASTSASYSLASRNWAARYYAIATLLQSSRYSEKHNERDLNILGTQFRPHSNPERTAKGGASA